MALTFLKKGEASIELAKKEEVAAQIRKETGGKMWRFWLEEGEAAKITFVDGVLDEKGRFVPPRFYEHSIFLNGSYNNYFVCPELSDPSSGEKCPLCEAGDRPSLVALFTIIDHRTHSSKDKTKTFTNQRRLLVAKPQTFELLSKLAIKRGGLAGWTYDVSRTGNKSANVGSVFDVDKQTPIEELKAMYTREITDPITNVKKVVTNFEPADYEAEIVFRTGDELRKMGLGQPQQAVTSPAGSTVPATDYSSQL